MKKINKTKQTMTKYSKNVKTNACWICLAPNLTDWIILDVEGPWEQLYNFCFGVAIVGDDVPIRLCANCQAKLKDFTKFKKMALRSAKLWQYFMNSKQSEVLENLKKEEDNIEIDDTFFEAADADNDFVGKFLHEQDLDDEHEDHKLNNIVMIKEEVNSDDVQNCQNVELDDRLEVETHYTNKKKNKKSKGEKNYTQNKQESPGYDCGLCEKIFSDDEELRQHLTMHSTNNDLYCKLCDYNGRDFADMVSHRFTHLSKEFKLEFRCHLCRRRSLKPETLQFHYRSVHLNEKGGKCTFCSKQFGNYKRWVHHERLHTTEKFICDVCGRRFLFRYEIIDHFKYHYEENTFICDFCGRGFKRNFNLKQHIQTRHHFIEVKCTHCDKMFKNPVTLKYHLREVASSKPYKCEVCSKGFRAPSLLKYHMICHKDIRRFACSLCGLTYKSNQGLKIHNIRKHTGHLPHKCDQCMRCFATTSQLKIHSSIHTGVRRHRCPQCPRSFHGRKDILAHIAKTHNRHTLNSNTKLSSVPTNVS